MRNIANIVGKEVRELLTLKLLAPFIGVLAVMFIVGRAIRGERARARLPQRALVAVYDTSAEAREVVDGLAASGISLTVTADPRDSVLARARTERVSTVIVVPKGTGQRLAAVESTEVEVYSLLQGFSATQAMKELKVKELFSKLNSRLAEGRIAAAFPGAEPKAVTAPLRVRQFTVIRGRSAEGDPNALTGIVLSQMLMIPMVLLMIIIYVSQMIAASIGQEKENKTLETLLTVPISRMSIVVGKMLGAVVVALVTTGIFFIAFSYYAGAFAQLDAAQAPGIGTGMVRQLQLTMTPGALLMVAATLLLGIICALSLATLLAVFAEDARSAQAMIAPVMVLCLLPYFMTLFFNLETLSLPLRLLVYAIPFSYPFMAPKAALFHEYGTVLWGCLYMAAFAAGTMFVAARIFTTDRILTAKLRLRRPIRGSN
ncbi:ABC transporter permease [candidate division WOR-3 bacterium]|nr:ABC transporter permease [candidate division WOR-3 bacterium]